MFLTKARIASTYLLVAAGLFAAPIPFGAATEGATGRNKCSVRAESSLEDTDKYVKLVNVDSGKVLAVKDNSDNPGTRAWCQRTMALRGSSGS